MGTFINNSKKNIPSILKNKILTSEKNTLKLHYWNEMYENVEKTITYT
jgi:hypothetical protein